MHLGQTSAGMNRARHLLYTLHYTIKLFRSQTGHFGDEPHRALAALGKQVARLQREVET